MTPQQDPDDSPESIPEADSGASDTQPTQDQPIPAPEPGLSGVDTSLDVDSNGFVAEHYIDDDVTPVDERESFQAQLAPVPVPKKSKKRLLIIIAAVITVFLVGGASIFAFWYNIPDKSVTDALSQLLTASSMKANGTFAIDSVDKSSADMNLVYDFAMTDNAFSADTNFGIVVDGKTTAIKSSFVATKDTVAIKMTNFRDVIKSFTGLAESDANYLKSYDGLINKIDNKWVVLTKDDLNQYTQDDGADAQATCAQNALTTFRTNKSQQNEVSDLYKNNQFVTSSDSLGSETINGKLSNRYELTIDDKKAQTFGDKLTETTVFKAIDTCYKGELSRQYKASKQDQASDKESKTTSKMELWVDVLSHSPTKIKLVISDPNTKMTLESTLQLNTSPQINVPTADTTLKDLQTEIKDLQQSIFGGAEDTIDTSVLGIRTFI